jgi:hypothetical protein
MRTYKVTIRAIVTKTLTVKAKNKDDAYEAASEEFTVLCDGKNEDYEQRYEQYLVDIKEKKA